MQVPVHQARRFKEIWLGSGTIFVQDETLGNDQAIGARDGNLYILGGAGLEVGQFTLHDNTLKIKDPTVDIFIGSTTASGNVIFNRPIRVNTPAGDNTFNVSRYGLTTIHPPVTIGTDESALNITLNNYTQPRNFTNTLLQMTGKDGEPSRVSLDAFGTGSYPVIAGRQAGGTAQNPTATISGDTLLRFSAQGWGDSGYVSTIGRINIQATQNFTDGNAGTRIRFQTTPTDSLTIQTVSADIDYTGLSLFGNSYIDAGITFRDGTRQITAATILPSQASHTGQYLKTDGSSLSWAPVPVATIYRGVWDAATNTPHLQDGVGEAGDQYVVSVAGTQNLGSGNQTFVQSDFVYYNGTIWERVPTATIGVNSIQFGSGSIKTGAVQVSSSDIVNTIANGSIATAKLATDYINFAAGSGITVTSQGQLGGNAVTITNTGITNITAGTGISVSGTNSITLTNTGVTSLSGSNHISVNSSTGGVTVTSDANVLSVANTIALRNGAGGIDAIDFTATGNSNTLTDHGLFNYGTLSYSDIGIMADFSSAVNSYNQVIIQNTSNGDSASANYIVSNNLGTNSAYYGEFGMNASGFTGSGSLSLPNAVYLNSVSSDLVIGGSAVHIVIADGSTDAVSISNTGIATFANQVVADISGSANNVRHAVTFATSGGAAPNSTFSGNTTLTVDYSTIGAQAQLSSGVNIKTVNNNSLVGSGNVSVGTVTSVGGTGTVSGLSLSGSVSTTGNLTLSGTITGLTNSNLSGTAGITNTNLANSTISGVSLGGNLYQLKPGTNVSFVGGTSYNGSTEVTVNVATGAGYTLPVATSSVLGGVKQGSNVTIAVDGTLSVAAPYTLPTAGVGSGGTLGGVKVDGTTVTISSGVISAVVDYTGYGNNTLYYALNATRTIGNTTANTMYSLFGVGATVTANTRYEFELVFTANGPSQKQSLFTFSGTATPTRLSVYADSTNSANNTPVLVYEMITANFTTTLFNICAGANVQSTAYSHRITGMIDIGATGGTVTPNIGFTTNGTGVTVNPHSWIRLTPVGSTGSNTVIGAWS